MPRSFPIDPNSSSRAQRRRNSESSSRQTYETKALPKMVVRGTARTVSEGFDPNAFDGDGDLRVQDGTAFERPAMPGMPDLLAGRQGITGTVTSGFEGMSSGQISEKAVPSSPAQMLEDIKSWSEAIGRDDFTPERLRSLLKQLGNEGEQLEFDFSDKAVNEMRQALRVALDNNPELLNAVQSLGLPPMAIATNLPNDVDGATSELYPFMFFRAETLKKRGRVGGAISKMRNSLTGGGIEGTNQKILGTEPEDLISHEFGHWMLVSALHKGVTPEQRELAGLYLQKNWEDWGNEELRAVLSSQVAQRLAQQSDDIANAVDNGDALPAGAPYVNSFYGQMSPAEMFAEGVSAYFSKNKNTPEFLNSTLASHVEKVLGKKPTGGMRSIRGDFAHIRRTQTYDIDAILDAVVPTSYEELESLARTMPTYKEGYAPGYADMELDFSDKAIKQTRAYVRRVLENNPDFADVVANFGIPPIVMVKKDGETSRFTGVCFPEDGSIIGINESIISGGLSKRALLSIADKLNLGSLAGLVSAHPEDTLIHEYGHYLAETLAAAHPNDSVRNAMSMMTGDTWYPLTVDSNIRGAELVTALARRMHDYYFNDTDPPSADEDIPWVNSAYGMTNPSEFFAEAFTARYSRHTKRKDMNESARDLVAMATGMRSERKDVDTTGMRSSRPMPQRVNGMQMPYSGPLPKTFDWLKDYSHEEIAEILVPENETQLALMCAQWRHADVWGDDPAFDARMMSQVSSYISAFNRALDFSPESIAEARRELQRALDTSPAFSWFVRNFGHAPVVHVSRSKYEEVRDTGGRDNLIPPLRDHSTAWYEPYYFIVLNGSERTWMKDYPPGTASYAPVPDPTTGRTVRYLQNIVIDRPGVINHEYGHFLYWQLTRDECVQRLIQAGYSREEINGMRRVLRGFFRRETGAVLDGHPTSNSDDPGNARYNTPYNPVLREMISEQLGMPHAKSMYAHYNPQEMFAEGFAAYVSQIPAVRRLINDEMKQIMDLIVRYQPGTRPDGSRTERPWQEEQRKAREALGRLLGGIGLPDDTDGFRSMRDGMVSAPFRSREDIQALDGIATEKAKGIINQLLENNGQDVWDAQTLTGTPYHESIPEDVAKRAEESVRINVTSDGMPVVRAEPHPLVKAVLGDSVDGQNEYELPKREVVLSVYKTLEDSFADISLPDENGDRVISISGKPIARVDKDGKLTILDDKYKHMVFSENNEESFNKWYGWINKKFKDKYGDSYSMQMNRPKPTVDGKEVKISGNSWASDYIAGLHDPTPIIVTEQIGVNRIHDMIGHWGSGNGFDRHGEWGGTIAILKLIDKARDEGVLSREEAILEKRAWLGFFDAMRLHIGRFDEEELPFPPGSFPLGTYHNGTYDSPMTRVYVGDWEKDVEQPLIAASKPSGMRSTRKPIDIKNPEFHQALLTENRDRTTSTAMVNDIDTRIAKGNLGMASKKGNRKRPSSFNEYDERFKKQYGHDTPVGDGDCFSSAMDTAERIGREFNATNVKVVHGVPLGTGGDAKGIRYPHAWAEGDINGVRYVFDFSNGNQHVIPQELYYLIGSIIPEDAVSYSSKDARKKALESGHYGPWE